MNLLIVTREGCHDCQRLKDDLGDGYEFVDSTTIDGTATLAYFELLESNIPVPFLIIDHDLGLPSCDVIVGYDAIIDELAKLDKV